MFKTLRDGYAKNPVGVACLITGVGVLFTIPSEFWKTRLFLLGISIINIVGTYLYEKYNR